MRINKAFSFGHLKLQTIWIIVIFFICFQRSDTLLVTIFHFAITFFSYFIPVLFSYFIPVLFSYCLHSVQWASLYSGIPLRLKTTLFKHVTHIKQTYTYLLCLRRRLMVTALTTIASHVFIRFATDYRQ